MVQKYLNTRPGEECYFSKSQGFIKTHDYFCLFHGERVEVKRDIKALQTKNLCIERALFEFSKSQIIAYVLGQYIYLFDRTQLWNHVVELKKQGKVRHIFGGDGNRNSLLLIALDDILHIADKVSV